MQISELEHFKNLLVEREHTLKAWFNSRPALDGEDLSRVRTIFSQIKESLGRIENQHYGICKSCRGEIEPERLELNPTEEFCLDCISPSERTLLEEELSVAGQIYRQLFPRKIAKPEGFQIGVRNIPAGAIGGDYYDVLPRADSRGTRLIIADTVGKGLPAGLMLSNLQGALRIYSEQIDSPALLISRLNQWICHNFPIGKFVSLVCICLDPPAGDESALVYSNAGHWPPVIRRADGRFERLEPTGVIMGIHPQFKYEERKISIAPGDYLLLYTDGIIEMHNDSGEMFEEQRLLDFLQIHHTTPPGDFLQNLFSEVLHFSGKSRPEDDMTAIALLREKS